MQNGRKMSFIDFLIRAGLWGGLGYVAGLRGPKLQGWSFIGPITEQVFGYSLEDIAAAMEQERIKKEQEVALAHFSECLRNIDFSFSKAFTTGNLNSNLSPSPKLIPAYSKWREVIKLPAIVLIFGGRGPGKSATAYRVSEDFKYSLSPYVVGFPERSKNILPEWVGIERRIEDVPPGSIVIVDEAYLTHHAREWQKSENRDICRLLNLSRQQDRLSCLSPNWDVS